MALLKEFKEFAFKGNMIDMAVGIVIGAAFGTVITSLVSDIFMPLIQAIGGGGKEAYEGWVFTVNQQKVNVGKFIGALVNFLIIALAIFIVIVKLVGMLTRKKHEEAPAEPTTRECPFCLSEVPIKATRCKCCTSELPAIAQ